jgi:hypothetical protein
MIASGLGIAVVACYFGVRRKTSVIDMNAAISRAIVVSTMLVLVIHSLVTVLEL